MASINFSEGSVRHIPERCIVNLTCGSPSLDPNTVGFSPLKAVRRKTTPPLGDVPGGANGIARPACLSRVNGINFQKTDS
uniref:Uncharacterized protein n=1 Tax=Rhizobium rhizogenes TaxID=359 RepID=A0A7S4ZS40_RHIRH|nr:hypothetical protein pC5.8b_452 [Rhizobium rhizogenes]